MPLARREAGDNDLMARRQSDALMKRSHNPEETVLPRPSVLRQVADWVFGYDFFISYAQRDGLRYPTTVKSRLEAGGYKVCLDRDDYVAGDDLPHVTRRRVRMSRKLVVVARPGALQSDWVQREVDIFTETGRTAVVVDVNQSVARLQSESALARRLLKADWLRVDETLGAMDADVSDGVIDSLKRSFDATRQETKRLRFLGGVAAGLAVLRQPPLSRGWSFIHMTGWSLPRYAPARDRPARRKNCSLPPARTCKRGERTQTIRHPSSLRGGPPTSILPNWR
jgi:hypothetical protein